MTYKCINNIGKFFFRDAYLEDLSYENSTFTLQLTGLIARYNNPSNDTLVDRYLADTSLRLLDARINKIFLEGPKYYSADDVLLESIPDTIIPEADYPQILQKMKGGILFTAKETAVTEEQYTIDMAIDIEAGEDEIPDTYWISLTYHKAITEWDQFLNRATVE